jgi:hypothetical protein
MVEIAADAGEAKVRVAAFREGALPAQLLALGAALLIRAGPEQCLALQAALLLGAGAEAHFIYVAGAVSSATLLVVAVFAASAVSAAQIIVWLIAVKAAAFFVFRANHAGWATLLRVVAVAGAKATEPAAAVSNAAVIIARLAAWKVTQRNDQTERTCD